MAFVSLEMRMDCRARRGATLTEKVRASLRGGEPSSVTRTVMLLVPPMLASAVGQLKTPFVGPMVASGGAPASRLNVSVLVSGSVALFVKVTALPAWTVRLAMAASTGG